MLKWKLCVGYIPNMIPELLSPVGSWESLVAAVYTGADAVYLGVGSFNARRHAQNFSVTDESSATSSLREAVAFCHARGVKVHVTLNTLVTDKEFPEALNIAEAACACGVDALIVQDRGLARRIHAAAPDMPLHASTQLSCHSPAGVKRLKEIGFSRVVLAREMSKKEIAACADLGVELEVFVHGALCMSVSGQCLLSAMLGGRSGNRGLCAQPCRLPFAAGHRPTADEAALSLKDNSLYSHIDELKKLGIASLKIEGRMKRPEYVSAATAALRRILDGKSPDEQLTDDLGAVFSRSGFTDGYFIGKR
ncbi:MAG: U32 family peptidase, partial [Clostridia bacterium]|nr:U32 family peptidase [Clostridia bacterium]